MVSFSSGKYGRELEVLTRRIDRVLASPITRWCSAVVLVLAAAPAFAQAGPEPFSNATNQIARLVLGPVARGFTLVAVAYGGLQTAYGDGAHHKNLGRLILGGGLALGATQIMGWLFGVGNDLVPR